MPNNFNNICINIAHIRHPIPPHTGQKNGCPFRNIRLSVICEI